MGRKPTPMQSAYYRFAFWGVFATIALYLDDGPRVLLPAAIVLGFGWWFVYKRDGW